MSLEDKDGIMCVEDRNRIKSLEDKGGIMYAEDRNGICPWKTGTG